MEGSPGEYEGTDGFTAGERRKMEKIIFILTFAKDFNLFLF